MLRVATSVLAVLVGAVTALAAVALHERAWALVLAVVATAAALAAAPPGWARSGYAAGWVLLVGYLTFPRPEGDYVLTQDLRGYAVLLTALVAFVVALATLPRPRRTAP